MTEAKIKEIPYGISDYGLIRRENYYYVDKTFYLKEIKKAGRYLFFVRPRRFGKSLFLATMEAYFDVYYKDSFEELFKGTWIYDHPTEERGQYLVLRFNFSEVDPHHLESSFLNHVRGRAHSFLLKYGSYFLKEHEYYEKTINEGTSAVDILAEVQRLCKDSQQKLYIIIDEYDNFANTILSTVGDKAYQDLTHGPGFFRAFFNVLKSGTGEMDAAVTRLFLTGVSPITLDDVTSGCNIGQNISIDPAFNRMLGFTRSNVREMIEYYKSSGLVKHTTQDILDIMDLWYGNYVFSKHSLRDEKMYNSDMVLYFLLEYFKVQAIPDDLIDRNVRIDYGKLRHLIILDEGKKKTVNGNFNRLKEIVEKGEIQAKLVKGFPLEELIHTDNFLSLLFYFGLLTIKEEEVGDLSLAIPNETIRRLFYDYIKRGYDETDIFSMNLKTYGELIKGMAMKGQWEPLFAYITGLMRESMCLRDLITGEKSVQAFLNVYLGLSNLYIIHAEKELNKGYADIVMEPFIARYEGIKYSYLLEIKYIKAGHKPGDTAVDNLRKEAEAQVRKYAVDEKFKKTIDKTTLIKLVTVFSGHELMHIGTVD
ncbi:MAG: AAA family ATPase [bacterium]|nr:AAA family ATPase [bacterium]